MFWACLGVQKSIKARRLYSSDLTTNDPEKQNKVKAVDLPWDATGAENHCTSLVIGTRPPTTRRAWTASDDGRVHITMDNGHVTDVSAGFATP